MHIRTFKAASLQAALADIRLQMGPDASVLHTRQIRDGWMGWLGRTTVEVTAGLKHDDETSGETPRESSGINRIAFDSRSLRTPDAGAGQGYARIHDPEDRMRHAEPSPQVNPLLETLQHELVQSGATETSVDRWMKSTESFAASLGETLTAESWHEQLQRTVARELLVTGPIRIQPGERHVVSLVGPTGVGKTTTIAKLAAGFRIEARRKVGLLTIDTFRIAAVQQLKAYAEIMDLPMQVVEQASQMREAMDKLGDVDLVLIDTAGRSPRSDARIDQLVDFLSEAQPDETHLVLSATSSPATIESVVRGFAPVRPTSAILTKLDETPNTASVLSAITGPDHASAVPLSYVTNGQQVPDDIQVATAETLVSRIVSEKMMRPQLDAA